jgi:predicted phage tail protein
LPPGPPTATRASRDPATGRLVVAWRYVWVAKSYEVWRSGTRLGTTTQTRFVDTTATTGSTYSYTVRAVNSQGRSTFGPTVTGQLLK